MPSESLELTPGRKTTRAALDKAFNGPEAKGKPSQGGVVYYSKTGTVLLFSDPKKSKDHGYNFDGWAESDDLGPVFDYTGTGTTGHQVLTGLNERVLQHQAQGHVVHLFISEGNVGDSGTRWQRYVGQMTVDTVVPYVERWDHDKTGALRRLYVFRLRPFDGDQVDIRATDSVQPLQETRVERVPFPETTADLVPPEAYDTDESVVNGTSEPRTAKRREAKLTEAFKDYLESQGHEVERYQIAIKGATSTLATDLYDATSRVLYEAKGRARRNDVRMAIGQLLDYRRHIPQEGLKLAILLPGAPEDDVRDLIDGLGMALVVPSVDGFTGIPD